MALIGAESVRHRAAVLDVMCALLRTPETDAATGEVAQRLLRERLCPDRSEFWPGMRVDLSGAVLTDLDLSQCRIDGDLRLDGCVLRGQSRLRGLVVGGTTSSGRPGSTTTPGWSGRPSWARSGSAARSSPAMPGSGAPCSGSYASFAGACFGGHAWFGGASFGQSVDFGQAVFHRSAGFRGAVAARVSLAGTTFHGPARVSLRGTDWNITAPGRRVVADDDNPAVGRLWTGGRDLIEKPVLVEPTSV